MSQRSEDKENLGPRRIITDDVDMSDHGDSGWNDEDEVEVYVSEIEVQSINIKARRDCEASERGDLATDAAFGEWTSAQMLLHAAELRYHALDIREDGLKKNANACECESEKWEAEGRRRKDLEIIGERQAWDGGCTLEVEPLTLEIDGVRRPWDWGIEREAVQKVEIPTLAKASFGH